jgi:hypothetical protein
MLAFQDKMDDLERRLQPEMLRHTDCVVGCDEGCKRILDTLRKENERQIAMTEIQRANICSLESRMRDELRKVCVENALASSRLSKLVELRMGRLSSLVRSSTLVLDNHTHIQATRQSRPPLLNSLLEYHENEEALSRCRLEMKLHAVVDSLNSALLRERTQREVDEAKLSADLEMAVRYPPISVPN